MNLQDRIYEDACMCSECGKPFPTRRLARWHIDLWHQGFAQIRDSHARACNDSPQSRAELTLWTWCSLAVAVCVGIVVVFA